MDWVAEHASGDEVEWHGCVTEVALQGAAGSLSRVTLGYYPMKEAEAIAALLAPTPELVRLNPTCILVADAAGDIYHYQLRYPVIATIPSFLFERLTVIRDWSLRRPICVQSIRWERKLK